MNEEQSNNTLKERILCYFTYCYFTETPLDILCSNNLVTFQLKIMNNPIIEVTHSRVNYYKL